MNIGISLHEYHNLQEKNNEANIDRSYKYVWAINGLNLRESPSTKSKLLSLIPYGKSVDVLEITEKSYINNFINNGGEEKHPILLKNQWVKIKYEDRIGYVIDGYLLEMETPRKKELPNQYLRRISKEFGYKKLSKEYEVKHGKLIFDCHQVEFLNKSISFTLEEMKNNNDSSVVEMLWYFRGFTTNEILVFMNPFFDIEKNGENQFLVYKNWKEKIVLLNGTDEIKVTKMNKDEVIFYFTTSC